MSEKHVLGFRLTFLQHFWDFLMIYALLSQDFDVEIHALFPQIFRDWKADSANLFAFRMYGCLQFSLFHNHTIDTRVFLKAKEGWEIPKEISSYPWNVDTSIFLWYISCREIPNKISSYSWHAGSSIFISNVSLIFDAQRNDSMFVRKGKQKPKWQNMCLEKKHAPPEKWINSCGPGFPTLCLIGNRSTDRYSPPILGWSQRWEGEDQKQREMSQTGVSKVKDGCGGENSKPGNESVV